jgi:[ribosomal protein S5]-alanine N-acetyltransferase
MDAAETGKGLTTAAVAALCRIGDTELDLHRIEASTLPSNLASQRVLAKNGFTLFGKAPTYLHINGEWTDSQLYQRILNDRPPSGV